MFWILTNAMKTALAANHVAVSADLFDGCANFHKNLISSDTTISSEKLDDIDCRVGMPSVKNGT
jgi:hypothetical protein